LSDDGYENKNLCAGCFGDCCRIYEPDRIKNGLKIRAWSDVFHSFRMEYNTPPFFHIDIVHEKGNAHLIEILREKGFDPYACEYMSPTGCIIDWDKRPSQCVAFRCEAMKKITEKDE